MQLAYVTIGKADDIHEWSGLNASIRQSLHQQGFRIHNVDQLGNRYPFPLRVRRRLHWSILGSAYAPERSPRVAVRWAQIAEAKIAQILDVDAIVSTGTLALAYLKSFVPKVIWADATFHSLRSAYPEYANYCRLSVSEGDLVEKTSLDHAAMICYASDWAADDAAVYYGIPREKIMVIPFGANCDSPFTSEAAAVSHVERRDLSVVRFVFIGVDWERKGGDLAVAIVRRLNQSGVKCLLTIIGCKPALADMDLPYVECLGFLSKRTQSDTDRFKDILLNSHFLLLPTSAECFGVVFAEACAFALPSISRAVGGVPTAVRSGKTGLLFSIESSAEAYSDALLSLIHDRARYDNMCLEAYRDYLQRLNWRVAGARFSTELRTLLEKTQRTDDPH